MCAIHADEVAVLTELIVRDTDAQFSDLRAVEVNALITQTPFKGTTFFNSSLYFPLLYRVVR